MEFLEPMQNQTNGSSVSQNSDISIDNLYPAIIQCFAIILAGYVAGRADMINTTQATGLGQFVAKFCLPALLFKSMVEMNFDSVNWMFLLGITISKTFVFIGVVGLTLLVKRPLNLGYAGLFGIFATQSNDFALGYPILQALYEKSNPEYLAYIYLVAPISLVLLNPIGFTLMEIHRRDKSQARKISIVLHVIKDVLMNPIVFMAIVGIIGNFVLKRNIPTVIDDILTVLGNAFSASALFYLGLSLVGKMSGKLSMGLSVPLLLIFAKTLLLPLITWQVVGALETTTNNSKSLSMYGFLYGTFPTAPSVFLYSSQFSIATDVIATGMVACTFLSAPLMFVSAKMMTVVVNSEMDYKSMLLGTSFDISIISLVCNIWVLALLLFSKKFKKMPHQMLVCLVLSQTLSCIGMIVYDGLDSKLAWRHYTQFVVLLTGVLSTRCWTAMISVVLYLIHCRSLCFVLRYKIWTFFFSFGIPVLCSGMLLLLGQHHMHNEIDPSFHYGIDQAIVSVVVLILCSTLNVVFLILRQRNSRLGHPTEIKIKHKKFNNIQEDEEDQSTQQLLSDESDTDESRSRSSSQTRLLTSEDRTLTNTDDTKYSSCSNCQEGCSITNHKPGSPTSIEDIVPFPEKEKNNIVRSPSNSSASDDGPSPFLDRINESSCLVGRCSYQQRRRCAGLLRCYHSINNTAPDNNDEEIMVKKPKPSLADEYQTGRFVVLLLFLQISMFMGLFLCTWRLFNNKASGIYVEIEFLDSVLNYGQGLIVFAIFGFDTKLLILPCIKRWRKWMYGVEVIHVPSRSELSEATVKQCEQFAQYHKESCVRDIVKDMKYRFRTYKKVFCGMSMCDWLIKVGLCHNRAEAVEYGRALLIGHVIAHVTSEHDFHDMPYFYRFTDDTDEDFS